MNLVSLFVDLDQISGTNHLHKDSFLYFIHNKSKNSNSCSFILTLFLIFLIFCLLCICNKNQIIIPCNLCINTTTKGNIFIDSKDFLNSLKSLSFPTNFTKSLTPCKIHNNKVSIYCENCEDYICEFCSKNEHGRHSFKLITEKIEEIKGFYIFSYDYLFEESSKKEVENMLSVMQSSNPD